MDHETGRQVDEFVGRHATLLIGRVRDYLAGRTSHADVYDLTCQIIDEWMSLGPSVDHVAQTSRETAFWATLWTTQVLASDSHWRDGIPQRELRSLIDALEEGGCAPDGYHGDRPARDSRN